VKYWTRTENQNKISPVIHAISAESDISSFQLAQEELRASPNMLHEGTLNSPAKADAGSALPSNVMLMNYPLVILLALC
jgi:hypothetical protein